MQLMKSGGRVCRASTDCYFGVGWSSADCSDFLAGGPVLLASYRHVLSAAVPQGMAFSCCSRKSQMCRRPVSYLPHTSVFRQLNQALDVLGL